MRLMTWLPFLIRPEAAPMSRRRALYPSTLSFMLALHKLGAKCLLQNACFAYLWPDYTDLVRNDTICGANLSCTAHPGVPCKSGVRLHNVMEAKDCKARANRGSRLCCEEALSHKGHGGCVILQLGV